MGANDKVAATFYPDLKGEAIEDAAFSTPDPEVVLDAVSLADWLCDQFQVLTEEGGNDLQGVYVDEVTLGGRIVTVEWSNGQRFQIEVWALPSMK